MIVVEHDLAVLDYMSDYICCLYGEPGAWGSVHRSYIGHDHMGNNYVGHNYICCLWSAACGARYTAALPSVGRASATM